MVMLKAWLAKQAKSSMTTEQRRGLIKLLIDQAISNGEIKTDDADEIDAWVQNNIIDR